MFDKVIQQLEYELDFYTNQKFTGEGIKEYIKQLKAAIKLLKEHI